MKLIAGLGNPEAKYRKNRHNVGAMVIDELQSTPRVKGLIFRKSDKFMNASGLFIKKLMDKHPTALLSDLYVVHDDLDIPLGVFKIQLGKGPRVHNGLNDIYDKLGSEDFWHVRVGVDNRNPENRTQGKDYVLEDFTEQEQLVLKGVIKQICNQLESL